MENIISQRPSGLQTLVKQPEDQLLGLIAQHAADTRPTKIDLGVGVFRNEAGQTPIMRAVKEAEAILLREQTSKSYLGAEGDMLFCGLLGQLVLGPELSASARIAVVQTPGGTGALRLGAELLARASPTATVWIGDPSWPNHAPLMRAAGLQVQTYRFYDAATGDIDFEAIRSSLSGARAGDIALLHGCCHNPTGADLNMQQWRALAEVVNEAGLIPFVDLAYQGLGNGLETDATPARKLLEAVPEALLAYSCDKNFGLYRERTGALWVQGAAANDRSIIRGNMLAIARSLWSMPPDHGAAIARTVFERPDLREEWKLELCAMRDRLNGLREKLSAAEPRLAHFARQRGMFGLLPVEAHAVASLRKEDGIYIAPGGRINIAGLTETNLPRFIDAIGPHLV